MEKMIQPIPECSPHDWYGAVSVCLETGLVKLPNLLSQLSVEKLKRRLNYGYDEVVSAAGIIETIPELLPFVDLLGGSSASRQDTPVVFLGLELTGVTPEMSQPAHIDTIPSTRGISILMPVLGSAAIFAASSEKFDVNVDTFSGQAFDLPDYMGMYGVGDGLMMHQDVECVNGQQKNLQRLYHCGIADSLRHVAALDFVTSSIDLR